MASPVDYAAVFAAAPNPYLLLGPDLVVVDANDAYLAATGRSRAELTGKHLFEAFPDNPADPGASGVRNLRESLERVLATGRTDTIALQKYDIPAEHAPGGFEERWWSPSNTPVLGPDGRVRWIIHRAEDVTAFTGRRPAPLPGPVPVPGDGAGSNAVRALEAELYVRARELIRLNDELCESHDREREVVMTLQESMLQAPDLARHHNIAVRYLPAVSSMNICGDWYDAVDLGEDRFAVAVGDVVGHGLEAAAVMGMLRSALSAAIRALARPAPALEALGGYARSVEGAMGTTAVQVLVDTGNRLLTYSSAGHPPPLLGHPDGSLELLDGATDPPLAVRPQHVPRPQASLPYAPGDTLLLYTDGLVERRGEDIDVGVTRLGDVLAGCHGRAPGEMADTLLAGLGLSGGGPDDVALVVVCL
ncbi:PP2C family protein-serine/threonine phosphatase [Streptomyces aidingensis]|uniref:Serine phosphatase RsbU, regulator of sigma subunit n=1 Tax=Streptomyces aidingensis TaxID=910347 RepID=A0A1I1IZR0_9ACTN|nr:SpoIIE family protein phosphatase [Streptomyces aidingensis]SFC39143.1 Serine phosphatase RsbU, regulator of sigma subunit [Streptomyces aidingensis]